MALGLSPSGEYSNINISDIPGHTTIKTTIADTTKLDGCEVGDKVELSNLSWKTWAVKHIPTGKQFLFEVKKEDGTLKISKIVPQKKVLKKGLTGKSGFGVRVSYVNYQDDDVNIQGNDADVEFDDDFGFGVNYTAFVSENFSLELSADYIESDVELRGGGYSGDDELEQIYALLAGRIHPELIGRILPYLSGGIGYFFNDIDSNDSTAEFLYGPGAKFEVDDDFGYFIGAGIEVFLSDSLSLNLDLKYIWTEIETNVNRSGYSSENIDVDPFTAGLGLKYYF